MRHLYDRVQTTTRYQIPIAHRTLVTHQLQQQVKPQQQQPQPQQPIANLNVRDNGCKWKMNIILLLLPKKEKMRKSFRSVMLNFYFVM